ncbi:hypothetical protein BK816_06875 [Boudabousia tangfeifanii]|uniref:Uncharacterized protein n=1 Tax=Boudabousia tangfeifanii TaxID=1912795 RepID=A0A1D9MLJ8_9ACTO|nr:hypothetical protein [Boudabousia tangfeifanii]AOZ73043.1 hypothetical protein BK816_06875 [Boudabousia tangfeifanii]
MTETVINSAASAMRQLASLTPTQYQVLNVLSSELRPITISKLSELTDIHPNSLRDHLEVLVENGQVKRTAEKTGGRGRPTWLYEPSIPASFESLDNLARFRSSAVRKVLVRRGIEIQELAEDFGREWAQELFAAHTLPTHAQFDPDSPRMQLELHLTKVRVFLSSLGFTARSTSKPREMVLLTCPVWDQGEEVDLYQLNLHWGLIDEILKVVSHGRIRATLIANPQQHNCILQLHDNTTTASALTMPGLPRKELVNELA